MGIALPQLAPASEDRVSGVPSIDGGFRFTSTGKGHLAKIPSVCGNRQRWTWSGWIKKSGQTSAQQAFMSASFNPGQSTSNDYDIFYLWDNATSNSYWRAQPAVNNSAQTTAFFRDNAGWYHLVCVSDTTQSDAANRMKIYVNGELQSLSTNWSSSQDKDTAVNGPGHTHGLGISIHDGDKFYDGIMAQVDFVDGRVVGPEEFAFTDPLTGTWRPKRHKLTGPNDGTVWSANCTSSTPNSGTVIADFFKGATGSCEGFQLASGGNIVLTKDIPNVTSIGIYSNTGSSFTLTVNEGQGDAYSATVNSRNNISIFDEFTGFSGTLHTLKLSGFGAGTCLNGISINGVMLIDGDTKNIGANGYYLPMDGNSPVGEDKSGITTPNNGTVWSRYLTASGNNLYVGAQGISKAFDGKTDTYTQQQNTTNPNFITFTPPGGIPHSSKVEVWIGNTANKVSYNGGSLQTMSSGWNTVASGAGTLTTLRFERASTSGTAVRAIRIDGHHLIDGVKGNSWTSELCGSVSLDKATGALPILNTGNGGAIARPGVLGSEVSKNYTVTVASVDGQSKYALDGVDRPSPTLYRGGTYIFDYTAANSHPFYLSSLLDGKHNSKARSVSFNGSNQSLSISGSSDYYIGTGDFTIEGFVWSSDSTANGVYNRIFAIDGPSGDTGGNLQVNVDTSAGNLIVWSGGGNIATGTRNICDSKWHHFAITRAGKHLKIFFDGQEEAAAVDDTNWGNFNSGQPRPEIGARSNSSGWWDGYISNVRLTVGQAVYTSDFDPPNTTLTTTSQGVTASNVKLLCCQDTASTTAAKIATSGTITANGSATTVNSHNPFLYNNVHGNFGLNTSTSNVTKITIPHYAADGLYYYCNQHQNMGNTTAMPVVTDVQKADPYAWRCVYALPLVGNNQDVSNQINCTLSSAKAVASNGNAGPISATSNFYSGSFDLDGNGDYLQTSYDADFSFLSQDFTAECWMNTTQSGAYGTTMGRWTSDSNTAVWDLRAASADYGNRFIFITRNSSGTGYFVDSGVNVNDGLWHHLAVCRQGKRLMVFVDGTMVTIEAMYHSVNDDTSKAMTVGYGDGSNYMDGQVQDVRVYKGVAKYTESFVVGSASPDVLPDSPSGVATKSKLTKITDGAVSFDGTNDNLTIPAHSDLDLSSGDFTVEGFVYPQRSQEQSFVTNWNSGGQFQVQMSSSGTLQASWAPYSTGQYAVTGTTLIRLKAWSHFAYTRSGNTFELFLDGVSQGTQTSSANGTTNNNIVLGENGGNGNRDLQGFLSNVRIIKGTALYTSNFTPPAAPLTNVTNTKLLCCQSNRGAGLSDVVPAGSGVNSSGTEWSDESSLSITTAGTTESGSLAAVFNGTTNANAANAFGYLNGAFDFTWTPDTPISYTNKVEVWTGYGGGTVSLNGGSNVSSVGNNWTELVNGSSGTITSIRFAVGSGGGWWSALRVDDVMVVDSIVKYGDVAATNFNPFNTDINTVRGQEGAYCTLNPLSANTGTFSRGNLRYTGPGSWKTAGSTMSVSTGKWYYEVTLAANPSGQGNGGDYHCFGFGTSDVIGATTGPGNETRLLQMAGTGWYKNFSGTKTDSSTVCVAGDVLSIAVDLDSNTFTFRHNNNPRASGTIGGTAGRELTPTITSYNTEYDIMDFNFGQKPFKFPPPDGYQPLTSSTVRPDTIIARPDQFFAATKYTGNTDTSQDINVGFAPDLVWQKIYSQAGDNALTDTVRGVGAGYLQSEDADKEKGNANDGISAFLSNGFRAYNSFNNNGLNWVSWCWKAGGSGSDPFYIDDVGYASAAAAGLDNGSEITPTGASIGTKQGFSIITYTATNSNTTVTHGLTQKPDFAIFKNRDSTLGANEVDWGVYHSGYGATKSLELNQTRVTETWGGPFNNTEPTSTKFTLGTGNHSYLTNGPSGEKFIAYIWHNVPGLQKFGTYDGTGSGSNAPFIELGFRPALVMLKSYQGTAGNWVVLDDKRPEYNAADLNTLCWNLNNGHNASGGTSNDILSNGFRIRGSSDRNAANTKYIYAAWAASPLSNLYGAMSNAR